MSREIKFRAWDTETKEMSHDFLSKNWLKVCIVSPYVELMQYTGLKDKNGVEIYEGDILKSKHESMGAVKWHVGWGAFCFSNHLYKDDEGKMRRVMGSQNFWNDAHSYEVIGNVWENPELLQKAEGDQVG